MTNSLWTLTMNRVPETCANFTFFVVTKQVLPAHTQIYTVFVCRLQSYLKCDFILCFMTKFSYCTTVPDPMC